MSEIYNDQIKAICEPHRILKNVFNAGAYDRMLVDQKRFGKSSFEIAAQDRLFR